jgi:hypothetical protein
MKIYNKNRNDQWDPEDTCMTITARFGTGGGNMPIVIDTIVFDASQITSPANGNRPQWGGGAAIPCQGKQGERW